MQEIDKFEQIARATGLGEPPPDALDIRIVKPLRHIVTSEIPRTLLA